ncbi:hypothetical protein PR048_005758, partial [Dryococelus australis]
MFLQHFVLLFGRPQVDTGFQCEQQDNKIKSKILNETAKRVAVAELMKFVKKVKEVEELMKTRNDFACICIVPCKPYSYLTFKGKKYVISEN